MKLAETHNSSEDYLKNILLLHNRNGSVRAFELAAEMGVTKPSVSVAMKRLRVIRCSPAKRKQYDFGPQSAV